MNEIIFSRLCYLVANPEEALIRLRFMSETTREYIALMCAFASLRENIRKLLEVDYVPSESILSANDSHIEKLSQVIERDFNKKAPVKE